MEREALYSLIYLEIISSLRSHLALQREELFWRERRSLSLSSLPTRFVYGAVSHTPETLSSLIENLFSKPRYALKSNRACLVLAI